MQYFWKEQDDIPAGMGYPLFGVIHILSVVITLLFVLCGLKAFLQLGFRNRKKVLKAIPVVMFLMEIFKDCFLIRVHRFGLGFLPLHICSIRITDERAGVIYIDPYEIEGNPGDASIILITHDHYDHFSPKDIVKIANEDTILVVPEKMENKAQEAAGSVGKIETVIPGVFREAGGLEFETVPAYNTLKPFHTKSAGWVGYILRVNGKRIYIAGDTDLTKEARGVKCDIALVPVGGTYTMDAKKAAELVNELRPEIAIPVHYGSVAGSPADADRFAEMVKEPVRVEIKMEKC